MRVVISLLFSVAMGLVFPPEHVLVPLISSTPMEPVAMGAFIGGARFHVAAPIEQAPVPLSRKWCQFDWCQLRVAPATVKTNATANATANATVADTRPQVLVIVSDHGSGTTDFGLALNTHPCMFNLDEVFALTKDTNTLWTTSKVAGCAMETPGAIFDAESGTLKQTSNPQLTKRFQYMLRSKLQMQTGPFAVHFRSLDLSDSPALYEGLNYSLADYFVRARDLVCARVPEDVCPPENCTITLKMFPMFVNGNTGGQMMKYDLPSKCQDSLNGKAMKSWRDALASFQRNPKVATLKISRDERDRQFSIFRREKPIGTKFDCNFPRVPESTFAAAADAYADGRIEIETCWADATGANKCLGDALHLVGLSTQPMAPVGAKKIAGEVHLDYSKHVTASASCKTNPVDSFLRMENDDVLLLRVNDADEFNVLTPKVRAPEEMLAPKASPEAVPDPSTEAPTPEAAAVPAPDAAEVLAPVAPEPPAPEAAAPEATAVTRIGNNGKASSPEASLKASPVASPVASPEASPAAAAVLAPQPNSPATAEAAEELGKLEELDKMFEELTTDQEVQDNFERDGLGPEENMQPPAPQSSVPPSLTPSELEHLRQAQAALQGETGVWSWQRGSLALPVGSSFRIDPKAKVPTVPPKQAPKAEVPAAKAVPVQPLTPRLARVDGADKEFDAPSPKVPAPEEMASKASTLPGRQHSWRRSKRRESRLEV